MKTKHVRAVAALLTVTTLALPGALLGAEKFIRQGITRVSQGCHAPYDADGFLARYYQNGASAGSSWESLVENGVRAM